MMTTDLVENYPGFPEGITGFELSDRMRRQAERFGLLIRSQEVLELKPGKPAHTVVLEDSQLTAGAIIIATGARYRRLGVPGKTNSSAMESASAPPATAPFLRTRKSSWWAGGQRPHRNPVSGTLCQKDPPDSPPGSIPGRQIPPGTGLPAGKAGQGGDSLGQRGEGVFGPGQPGSRDDQAGKNPGRNPASDYRAFIAIGMLPNTGWLKDLLPLDEGGFMLTDVTMATEIPGIFAAGDVRSKLWRQISTAVGDGSVAAIAAENYLEELKRG